MKKDKISVYYNGDLNKDMEKLYSTESPYMIQQLDSLGKEIGYGRCQQVLQILWAKYLDEKGYPKQGALLKNKINDEDFI